MKDSAVPEGREARSPRTQRRGTPARTPGGGGTDDC